ncbi:hypothetical protein [Paenibacillus sp. NPDC058071]|uniref:hypothetical protein n=1 Tax=Paenibacillus sp. NPDC058071 TaxID=3346326 RepID=UPI0036DAC7FC
MPAGQAYVLSPSDVSNIRRYVQHKFAEMPQDKKAQIVADAVNRIIHKQLPDFDEEVKRRVAVSLIRASVIERQTPVRTDDIFEACLALDVDSSEIVEPLRRWAEARAGIAIAPERFERMLTELQAAESAIDGPHSNLSWERFKANAAAAPPVAETAATVMANVIPMPIGPSASRPADLPAKRPVKPYVYGLLFLLLAGSAVLYGLTPAAPAAPSESEINEPIAQAPQSLSAIDGLPTELRYTQIDKKKLAAYLEGRNSMLAEQPYMDAIIDAAKAFDIHPVLLFAITGQEQGFVPKTNKLAKEIVNNPFNVFHSWEDYNTTIHDSAEIAARTIVNLSKGRPEGTDPIVWINRKYAEDPNWSKGVRSLFGAIISHLEK